MYWIGVYGADFYEFAVEACDYYILFIFKM